jgi:hypothetical protein
LKSNEIQLKKKGMDILAQCIENMLITSISHEYGVQKKKKKQPQKNTTPKRCTPFHSIQVKFQDKIYFGMTRHLVHLKPIYPILWMLPWPLELATDARSQMMVMNIKDHDKFAETQ